MHSEYMRIYPTLNILFKSLIIIIIFLINNTLPGAKMTSVIKPCTTSSWPSEVEVFVEYQKTSFNIHVTLTINTGTFSSFYCFLLSLLIIFLGPSKMDILWGDESSSVIPVSLSDEGVYYGSICIQRNNERNKENI